MKLRGCGRRVKGGVYLETLLPPNGTVSISQCLMDPPVPIDPESIGLEPIGVTIKKVGQVYHVFDWIGSKFYPNPTDFIEEMFRMGVSRRITRTADFEKLTKESKMLLVHADAVVTFQGHSVSPWTCPLEPPKHADGDPDCIGKLWCALRDGPKDDVPEDFIEQERLIGDIRYKGHSPAWHVKVTRSVGVFATAPIHNIAVVKDPDDPEGTIEAVRLAQVGDIPVSLEDE